MVPKAVPGQGRAAGSLPAGRWVILMRRDSLAAQLATGLKWLPPACLSGRRLGRGKGSHSLGNLKPRVNPCFCI